MFSLIRETPEYGDRDQVIGVRRRAVRTGITTKVYALKLAEILNIELEALGRDDSGFFVQDSRGFQIRPTYTLDPAVCPW